MGDGRILIVDDDLNTRSAYQDLFTSYGFETQVAETQGQALELLNSEEYEAILMDLRVPNSELFSIAERVKKQFPQVFVSIMTIDATPAMIKKTIDAGIDECLVKPLLPMRLIDEVKKGILRYRLEKENYQLKQQVKELQAQNRQWVMHDLETGVFNSHYFIDRLDTEVKRAKRHEHLLSLLLCDLGQFVSKIGKEESNTYSVDEVLELLKILSGNIRDVDIVARYNTGFAIILPETTSKGSATLCNRLKKNVIDAFEDGPHIPPLKPDVRFGVATYPLDSHLPKKLIKIAEERLQ